jgi:hypothetical protein
MRPRPSVVRFAIHAPFHPPCRLLNIFCGHSRAMPCNRYWKRCFNLDTDFSLGEADPRAYRQDNEMGHGAQGRVSAPSSNFSSWSKSVNRLAG